MNDVSQQQSSTASVIQKRTVLSALRTLGADRYDLSTPETRYLPQLMKPHEQLLGVLYGRYKRDNGRSTGRGLVVATDERLLFVDRKPFYLHYDEVVYGVVSGITFTHVGISIAITISTRMGDITFRTFNRKSARQFVTAVEQILFEHQIRGVYDNDHR